VKLPSLAVLCVLALLAAGCGSSDHDPGRLNLRNLRIGMKSAQIRSRYGDPAWSDFQPAKGTPPRTARCWYYGSLVANHTVSQFCFSNDRLVSYGQGDSSYYSH
jgi:hypothetical protein